MGLGGRSFFFPLSHLNTTTVNLFKVRDMSLISKYLWMEKILHAQRLVFFSKGIILFNEQNNSVFDFHGNVGDAASYRRTNHLFTRVSAEHMKMLGPFLLPKVSLQASSIFLGTI